MQLPGKSGPGVNVKKNSRAPDVSGHGSTAADPVPRRKSWQKDKIMPGDGDSTDIEAANREKKVDNLDSVCPRSRNYMI
jgi:hypothetical protein